MNKRIAYGETKAPADVDTLRDEACPICSEVDAYDGNECQICGYVAPPKPFRDPDVDLAKTLDLRKQLDESQDDFGGTETGEIADGTLPDAEEQNTFAYENDQAPVDSRQVDEDGRVPVDVRALDADGAPIAQTPVALDGIEEAFGEEQPPLSPQDLKDEESIEEREIGDEAGSYLSCPNCGLNAPSAGPLTNGDSPTAPNNDGMGLTEGSICPNCNQGILVQGAQLMATSAAVAPAQVSTQPAAPVAADNQDPMSDHYFSPHEMKQVAQEVLRKMKST